MICHLASDAVPLLERKQDFVLFFLGFLISCWSHEQPGIWLFENVPEKLFLVIDR